MKNFIKTGWFTFGTYLLLVMAFLLIGFVLLQNNKTLKNVIVSFFEVAESRTFDYRQMIKVMHKHPVPSGDIVILAIDDASLEMLWDKYGEWPIPRNVYGDVIKYLEEQSPKAVIFDLMFIKSIKSSAGADKYLSDMMNAYPNVYTGMNFDNQTSEVRTPINLPARISAKVENSSDIDIKKKYEFSNCRPVLPELLYGKTNIGMTNVMRSSDGIIRKVPPFMVYKNSYYPYLSFKAGSELLGNNENSRYTIGRNHVLTAQNISVPLTPDGDAILNWYGQSGVHNIYPMYRLIKEMENKNVSDKFNFKDKIVIIGTTAMSLQDTKSVPVQEGVYPGVEVHATFINNLLDKNFIKKTETSADICIILSVIALVGIIVMLSSSTIFAFLSTVLFSIAYILISYYVMALYNLWVPVVLPIISVMMAFALSFLAKYLMKSRDFEYQYKLATIDGLTELYNHRYFQDSIRRQIDLSKRYEQKFSLIIIDIDFFKKFNDSYGHQAGDAVLRQVAQILKKNSRATDCVCRYGGEEMSIILPNTNAEEALNNANRICKSISETPFHLNASNTVNVTISVGVSTYPDNAETPQDLIEWADKGLYYAKEHGRNQVGIHKEN